LANQDTVNCPGRDVDGGPSDSAERLNSPMVAQSWKQERRQNGDDGKNDQKLDQCERSSSLVLQTALLATRFSPAFGELPFHWRSKTQ
jgi:hypothetical protein